MQKRLERVCVTTAAVAAVCDRRSLFLNSFGAHRAPLQLENGSCHTDSKGRLDEQPEMLALLRAKPAALANLKSASPSQAEE